MAIGKRVAEPELQFASQQGTSNEADHFVRRVQQPKVVANPPDAPLSCVRSVRRKAFRCHVMIKITIEQATETTIRWRVKITGAISQYLALHIATLSHKALENVQFSRCPYNLWISAPALTWKFQCAVAACKKKTALVSLLSAIVPRSLIPSPAILRDRPCGNRVSRGEPCEAATATWSGTGGGEFLSGR